MDNVQADNVQTDDTVATAADESPPKKVVVSDRLQRMAKKRAEGRVGQRRDSIQYDLLLNSRNIARLTEELQNVGKEVEKESAKWCEVAQILTDAGFKFETVWGFSILITLKEERLPALARVIGRVDMDKAEKVVAKKPDPKKKGDLGSIWIKVPCVKYDFVSVKYEHKLTQDDPCKIEETTRTDLDVVCRAK